MIRRFLKITQKIAVVLLVFILTFTNGLSYFLLALNTVYENANIVDTIWKAQSDGNVVDRFTPLEKIAEDLRVPLAHAAQGDARAIYTDSTLASPDQARHRVYTGSTNSWGAAGSTSQITGATIRFEVIRYAPTRDEALAGVWEQSGSGSTLRVLRWNGSVWSTEWSTTTTNTTLGNNVRPFDIGYERASGDALVVYSTAAATTNELAYRTWNGVSWVGPTNFDVVGTTALACGVELQNRPSSDRIAMVYTVSATTNSLNTAVWNGGGWESNPSTARETGALEAGTACQYKNFDIAWEETSGEILAAWGRNAITQWAYSTCTGAAPCTWAASAVAGTEDGTVLDMATQPGTDNIAISVIGNAGADEGAGFWNGTSWSSTGTPDAGAGAPVAGNSSVGVGWLTNGGNTKAVLIYADVAEIGVDYASVNNGVVNLTETQCGATPPAVLERQVKVVQDPSSTSKFLVLVENANSDLFAIRFTMDAAGAITCADTNGGAALNANLTSVTSAPFDFDYERFIPPPGPDATDYTNGAEAALNFSACATTGCGGRIGQAITVTGTDFGADPGVGNRSTATNNVKIATFQVPTGDVTAWSNTSITITVSATITVFGGSGTTCGGADGNGLCVTAGGAADLNGALQFFVFPDITSISPSGAGEGREGDSITITGNRFDTVTGTVTIAGVSATVGTWGDTSVTVTVPTAISDSTNTGDVVLTRAAGTGSKTDTSTGFTILPDITSTTVCASCSVDADREFDTGVSTYGIIMLNGNHFGTGGSATIDGIAATQHTVVEGPCTTATFTNTAVCYQVPATILNTVYTVSIVLTRTAGPADSKTETYAGFRILPKITSFTPASVVVGAAVTVNGDHFCQDTGVCPTVFSATNKVTFNSAVDATVFTSWSDTAIATAVPTGATTGNVTVTSNSRTSNGLSFTVASTVPFSPTNLEQKKSDGVTVIATNNGTNGTTVVLEGDISAGTSITMVLDVEVKAIATAFDALGIVSSTAQTGTSFPNTQVTSSVLTNGTEYHWRARTRNTGTTETSAWVAYGANPTGDGSSDGSPANRDFFVDTTAPGISGVGTPPSCTSHSAVTDVGATIAWTASDAFNASSITNDVRSGTDSTLVSGTTSAANSGTAPSKNLTGLTASTTYYYWVKSTDSVTNANQTPSAAPFCSFTTTGAVVRIMRTTEHYLCQDTSTSPNWTGGAGVACGTVGKKNFDVFFGEHTVAKPITQKSGYVEITGITNASTAVGVLVSVNGETAVTYNIASPASTSLPWYIIHPVTSFNIDYPADTTAVNTLDISFTGTISSTSLLNARVVVTYFYTP